MSKPLKCAINCLLVMQVCYFNHQSIKFSKAAHLRSSEHTEWLARIRFLEERNRAVTLDADAPLEEDKELPSCHKAIPAAMAATKVQLFFQLSTALLLSSRRLKYEKKKNILTEFMITNTTLMLRCWKQLLPMML